MATSRRTRHGEPTVPAPRPRHPAPPPSPDRFDRWAATYDASLLQHVLYRPVHRAVLQHAHRHARHAARILDVGCGTGLLLQSAARTHPNAGLVGVDPSAQMLGRAARTTPHAAPAREHTPILLARAAAEALPFRDATFDLVLSTLSLRHWNDPGRALAEIARVATRTGVVIVADALQPPARRPQTRWWPPRAPHRGVPLPIALARAITAAGLRPSRVEPVHLAIPMAAVTVIVARPASAG